jgi:hypothetical protein
MREFVRHLVVPLARQRGWRGFCEIGASTGLSADEILKLANISYTIVDPCFDADLPLKYSGDSRVTVYKTNSLDALPRISGKFDCILIDGDHNWYTVSNELSLVQQRGLLREGGMVFIHDIDWPYGRRDLYYQPETIPIEHRLDYERKGIVQGKSQLVNEGGHNPDFCHAVHEGGPRNGVLTAIDDFVAANSSEYHFGRIRSEFGLGILQYKSGPGANRLTEDISFFICRRRAAFYASFFLFRIKARTRRLFGRGESG